MAIPKIIHQTGASGVFSGTLEMFRQELLQLHPHWEYRFYDDMDCRDVINEHYLSFLSIYDSFRYPVQKADFFRWAAVHQFGGFYLDLDMQCFKTMDGLCRNDAVFCEETSLTGQEKKLLNHRDSLRIGNFMFGAMAGHPFMMEMMNQIKQESTGPIRTEDDILETTGPGLLTRVYVDRQADHNDIALVRNFNRMCPYCLRVSCHFGDYARHYHVGSWRGHRQAHAVDGKPDSQNSVREKKLDRIYAELKRIALMKNQNSRTSPSDLRK